MESRGHRTRLARLPVRQEDDYCARQPKSYGLGASERPKANRDKPKGQINEESSNQRLEVPS